MAWTGRRFGRLAVLSEAKKVGRYYRCTVRCRCGTVKSVIANTLTKANHPTRSCGCAKRERAAVLGRRTGARNIEFARAAALKAATKHGFAKRGKRHSLHAIWTAMRQRCLNPKNSNYPSYGGRGIGICSAWSTPESFIRWGLRNGWRPGLSVDRIDNDGDYSPRNCRFANPSQQARNQRLIDRKTVNRGTPRGVRYRGTGYWAQARIGGVNIHLGRFDSMKEAAAAYRAAKVIGDKLANVKPKRRWAAYRKAGAK